MMKQNVGVLDSAIRSVISVILLALAFEQIFSPVISVAMAILGLALWINAGFGYCLIYKLLGIDTYPTANQRGAS